MSDPDIKHTIPLRDLDDREAGEVRLAGRDIGAAAVYRIEGKLYTFSRASLFPLLYETEIMDLDFAVGDEVVYETQGARFQGTISELVEGWYRITFTDGSEATVRPSRVSPR